MRWASSSLVSYWPWEHAVEAVHERQLRDGAREAIRSELSQNLDALRRRAEVQVCVDRRLAELETLLVSMPDQSALPRPLWVGRPQVWNIRETLWQAATSGARTSLLLPVEQAGYARLYELLDNFENHNNIEQLAWARLRALGILPTLEPETRASLVEALLEARYANFRIKVAAAQAHDAAKELKLKTVRSPFPEGSRSVCIPMNTPRDEAMKIATDGREDYGEP